MKIDYVLPYVRPTENWLKDYNYYTNAKLDETRFGDRNLIKFLKPSIEKYAPWINSVKLIVSSEDQVPEELKSWDKLDVILHKEFIPEKYLPTFNSSAIDMFLPFLPRTSEYFIYGNDDFLFWNTCTPEDFFTKGKPRLNLLRLDFFPDWRTDSFKKKVLRCTKLVYEKFIDINTLKGPIIPHHGRATPGRLSYYKEAYEMFKDSILDSLTAFRNNHKNYNQYIYTLYMDAKKVSLDDGFKGLYIDKELKTSLDSLLDSDSKMICINDTENTSKEFWDKAWSKIEQKLNL